MVIQMILNALYKIKAYIYNVLITLDQLINSLLLGDPDETLSSRLGRVFPDSWIVWFVDQLFFWQSNHCHKAIESQEGRKDLIWPVAPKIKRK